MNSVCGEISENFSFNILNFTLLTASVSNKNVTDDTKAFGR